MTALDAIPARISAKRSNGSAQRARHAANRSLAGDDACLECGGSCAANKRPSEFCSRHCRNVFHHRRASRGAELYDLFMALRHDRETAKLLKLWRILNRMAALFRQQDDAERDGRRSWIPPRQVLARHPYLKADRLVQGRKRYD